jgi:hypothetical protein
MERMTFDLARDSLTSMNTFLHRELAADDRRHITVLNPDGAHNIAVGLNHPVTVEVQGHAGYYAPA